MSDRATIPHDLFTRKHGGVSLDDIANLPPRLSMENLDVIFNYWGYLGVKAMFGKYSNLELALTSRIATRGITDVDAPTHLTPRLRNVRSRFECALTFYSEFLLNSSADKDISDIVETFPRNMQIYGFLYLFETSGLSLSSVQKLIILRGAQTDSAGRLHWIIRKLAKYLKTN